VVSISLPELGAGDPSLAVKKRTPLTLVRLAGLDEPDPRTMSASRAVPAAVPSLVQSSRHRGIFGGEVEPAADAMRSEGRTR